MPAAAAAGVLSGCGTLSKDEAPSLATLEACRTAEAAGDIQWLSHPVGHLPSSRGESVNGVEMKPTGTVLTLSPVFVACLQRRG